MPNYNESLDLLEVPDPLDHQPGLNMDHGDRQAAAGAPGHLGQGVAASDPGEPGTGSGRHCDRAGATVRPRPAPGRRPLRRPPLARREARWGLLFISPWIIGFLAFTLLPMLATLAFTLTNLTLEQQDSRSGSSGLDNYSRCWPTRRCGSRSASRSASRCSRPAGRGPHPVRGRLLLNSRHLGRRPVPGAVLPALRRPVRRRCAHLAGDAERRQRLDRRVPALLGVADPPDWLQDPAGSIRAWSSSGSGGSGAGSWCTSRPRGDPDRAYDAARSTGPVLRPASSRDAAAAVAGHLLPLILGIVDVLQYFLVPLVLNKGTGEPGGTTLFLNLYSTRTSSATRTSRTGRRSPGSCSASPC